MQISKPVFSLMIGLLLVFLPAAFAGADSSTETAVLQVDGMTCGSCAAGIQAVLGNLDGVQTADVSFAKGQAIVRFDPERASLEALSEAAAQRNRWEFLLTVAPIAVPGGTGSPVNPIATF